VPLGKFHDYVLNEGITSAWASTKLLSARQEQMIFRPKKSAIVAYDGVTILLIKKSTANDLGRI